MKKETAPTNTSASREPAETPSSHSNANEESIETSRFTACKELELDFPEHSFIPGMVVKNRKLKLSFSPALEAFAERLGELIAEDAPQESEEVQWCRQAAEQGNSLAQFKLGILYESGQGVRRDWREAVMWYRKAAEQGNSRAQSNLGVLYGDGRGVPQDYVEAHKWFNIAAADGNAAASKNRDVVAELMTPELIAEAQKLAREWFSTRSTEN